jgi:hypothetical protein
MAGKNDTVLTTVHKSPIVNIAIENCWFIVDIPHFKIVMFHSFLYAYYITHLII